MENYLPKWGLQILNRTFFDKMYNLCYGYKNKNIIENPKCTFHRNNSILHYNYNQSIAKKKNLYSLKALVSLVMIRILKKISNYFQTESRIVKIENEI